MCNACPNPKFLLREADARLNAARPFAAQDHEFHPKPPPPGLAALRLWWQRVGTRKLRKGMCHMSNLKKRFQAELVGVEIRALPHECLTIAETQSHEMMGSWAVRLWPDKQDGGSVGQGGRALAPTGCSR